VNNITATGVFGKVRHYCGFHFVSKQ